MTAKNPFLRMSSTSEQLRILNAKAGALSSDESAPETTEKPKRPARPWTKRNR